MIDEAAAARLFGSGRIEVLGLLPFASNYTFLARITSNDDDGLAVYKPTRGERPLWDFPDGTLAAREVAAYLVSRATGWDLVPPTILRESAPLGPGSLQLFVDHDPERHYLVLREEQREELPRFAAFDIIVNNADRKSGHVLEDRGGRLWAVDHGVTFHEDPKLRTVIWDFAGEPLPDEVVDALQRVRGALSGGGLAAELEGVLGQGEVLALESRVDDLLAAGRFPSPSSDHPFPWPLV